MPRVPATEFKARCLEFMDRVAERRESYVITKRGQPVAMLVPMAREVGQPLFGRLRGTVEELGDIIQPAATGKEWAGVLEEWDELDAAPAPRARKLGKPRRTRL